MVGGREIVLNGFVFKTPPRGSVDPSSNAGIAQRNKRKFTSSDKCKKFLVYWNRGMVWSKVRISPRGRFTSMRFFQLFGSRLFFINTLFWFALVYVYATHFGTGLCHDIRPYNTIELGSEDIYSWVRFEEYISRSLVLRIYIYPWVLFGEYIYSSWVRRIYIYS